MLPKEDLNPLSLNVSRGIKRWDVITVLSSTSKQSVITSGISSEGHWMTLRIHSQK